MPDKVEDNKPDASVIDPLTVKDKPTSLVIDGKEMTPEQIKEALGTAKAATSVVQAAKAFFSDSATLEQRREEGQKMLRGLGFSEDQAKAWVAENFPEETPAPEPKKEKVEPQGGQLPEAVMEEFEAIRRERLQEHLVSAETAAFETPEMTALMTATKRLKTPTEVEATKKTLGDQIRKLTIENTRLRISRTNERVTRAVLVEEAKKAAKEMGGLFSAVIGDAASLGRTADTDSLAARLASKPPVKLQPVTAKTTMADAEKSVEDYITDKMLRLALETKAPSGV